ncbi:TerC/Alx family metal homeostasis membrane protein [Flavobacterium pectinovorum]|uniref:TerC/Alx family metal homeostasis membrane protein n=1 Tax=Flavobacterium pectinovorum TaxID=29533 RepID=UPI001FAE40D9|nr:TerC/Alx family metal homeostasis membrane protein [Flavobacterium pectinovorum]MCI9845699.1 TerC/Alx family metal homeostasis membrane protein [Flavobacterium pectinovorum]
MIVWTLFLLAVVFILALDLGVFNKTPHIISTKEASKWTLIWVTLSFLFSGVIYWLYTTDYIANPDNLKPTVASMKFITGYLIELSLSVDNIFVIAIIFASFKIPQKYQHRVLFWGILGAIVFRGLMIFFGVMLINKFTWTTYVFGAFLLFTAIKMLFSGEDEDFQPKDSFVYKALGKIIPITSETDGEKFFITTKTAKKAATPLFVALIVIEVMDVLFAVDSVPAILAITSDPFLVFSSNIFAILGLRSMYFFLANMLAKFSYLEYSLVAILAFVGLKMLLHDYIHLPEWASLGFIAFSLLVGILVSLKFGKEKELTDLD